MNTIIFNADKRRKVLDISKWQPQFDAKKAKAKGIAEVVCRASYGSSKDIKLDNHAAAVLGVGLTLSAYSFCTAHYSSVNGGSYTKAISIATAQANAFVAYARAAGVNGFLALDIELENGQKLGLSKQQLTDFCNTYLAILAAAGYPALLYMSASPMATWLYIDEIRSPLWVAYYYKYGTALNYDNDPSQGNFPATTYGSWMRSRANRIMLWQFTSEGYAAMYGVGSSDAAGLDKNYGYFDYSKAGTAGPAEGVQSMKIVDVYAQFTAAQTGGKVFNVQTFGSPDIANVVGNNLPDGRYWCTETGCKLAGLEGFEGVQIMAGDKAVYVAIIPGATEYTEMTAADAYARFVAKDHDCSHTKAELLEVQQKLADSKADLEDAQKRIANAKAALAK